MKLEALQGISTFLISKSNMFCKKMIQIYDPHHVLHRVETFRWNFNMFSDIQICKTEMKLDFFMIFCPCKNNIVFASLNIWEIGFISFIRNLKCVSFLPFMILVCRFDKYALWDIFFKLWIWNKNLHEIEV